MGVIHSYFLEALTSFSFASIAQVVSTCMLQAEQSKRRR